MDVRQIRNQRKVVVVMVMGERTVVRGDDRRSTEKWYGRRKGVFDVDLMRFDVDRMFGDQRFDSKDIVYCRHDQRGQWAEREGSGEGGGDRYFALGDHTSVHVPQQVR